MITIPENSPVSFGRTLEQGVVQVPTVEEYLAGGPASNETASGVNAIASKCLTGVLAVSATAAYGFEIGPWNEVLRIDTGLEVLQRTQNALLVGGTVAAITAAIEIVPGTLVATALNRKRGVANKLNKHLEQRSNEKVALQAIKAEAKAAHRAEKDGKARRLTRKIIDPLAKIAHKGADVAVAFGGGSAMLVAKRHFTDDERSLKSGLRNAAVGTAWIAALGGTLGYLIAGGINAVSEIQYLEKPAELVVDYGSSKTFWLGALGIGYGTYGLYKLSKKTKNYAKGQLNSLQQRKSAAVVDETI